MKYEKLERYIIKWGCDKGIINDNPNTMAQAIKTLEEVNELLVGIHTNNDMEIKDALGDIMVTLIIQAKMQNLSLTDCLEHVYTIISKRTGKMSNGFFVKDGEIS